MLETTKQVTVSGSSIIDGKVVATMYADLKQLSISKSIIEKSDYEANKETVRADFSEFEQFVFDEQDKEEV